MKAREPKKAKKLATKGTTPTGAWSLESAALAVELTKSLAFPDKKGVGVGTGVVAGAMVGAGVTAAGDRELRAGGGGGGQGE